MSKAMITVNAVKDGRILLFEPSASVERSVNGADTLKGTIVSDKPIDVGEGDAVLVQFSCNGSLLYSEMFACVKASVKKTSMHHYEASLDFESHIKPWLDGFCYRFRGDNSAETLNYQSAIEFSLTGTLREHLDCIAQCSGMASHTELVTEQTAERIRTGKFRDIKTLSFSCVSCWGALVQVAEEFGLEWTTQGGRIELDTEIAYRDGRALAHFSGLADEPIEIEVSRPDDYATRVYALGGTKNIPLGYRNYKSNRLMLPSGLECVEATVQGASPRERAVIFEDVYPHREGRLTKVEGPDKDGVFRCYDTSLDFDIKEHLTDQPAKCEFTFGLLAGMAFEIMTYDSVSRSFTLRQKTENGVNLPSLYFYPSVGDRYVLTDINMPEQYVVNAERELKERAEEYLKKHCNDGVTYKVSLATEYHTKNAILYRAGEVIAIEDKELSINDKARITKVRHSFWDAVSNGFLQSIDLNSSLPKSRLKEIETQARRANAVTRIYRNEVTNISQNITNSISVMGEKNYWLE